MAVLPRKAHWPPAYIYLQSAAIALAVWWFTRNFYQDDSYITLVYARNWIEGYGLVWSRGDEPVEGYSNFLYMVLIAALGWLGMDLVLASRVVSFAGYVGLVGVLYAFMQTIYRRRFAGSEKHYAHQINAALCVGLVASSVPVLAWVMGGLEAVLFAALVTGAVSMVLYWLEFGLSRRMVFVTGVIFALATMTRMEGLMIWGMTGIIMGIFWLMPSKRTHLDFTRLMLLFFAYMLLFAPWMAWKYHMYGDFLPNTYYAKVTGIPSDIIFDLGIHYLLHVLYVPPLLPLAALVLFLMTLRYSLKSRSVLYLLPLVIALLWHIITSGGDHMKYLRFYVPIIPILVLFIYYAAGWLIEKNEKHFRDFSGTMIVFSILQFGYVHLDDFLSKGALSGLSVGPYINENWPPGSLIAINPAGALPYIAPQFRYIDMLGLNDRHIARQPYDAAAIPSDFRAHLVGHLKGDGPYVLSREPDFIIWGHIWGASKPAFLSDYGMLSLPEFIKNYRMVERYIDVPNELLPLLRMNYEVFKGQTAVLATEAVLNKNDQLRFVYFERIKP